jgi:hypothetical protein
MVAAIPHLVAIVEKTREPAWGSVPDYTVTPRAEVLAEAAIPSSPETRAVGAEATDKPEPAISSSPGLDAAAKAQEKGSKARASEGSEAGSEPEEAED